MRVVLTDAFLGKHIIFSLIEKNMVPVSGQKHLDYLPVSDTHFFAVEYRGKIADT